MAKKNSLIVNIKMLFSKVLSCLKKTSWKTRVLFIVIVIIVIAIVFIKIKSNGDNGYIFETVGKHDITEKVTESGNVSTAGKTPVYSPSTGIVEELYVENGDIVGINQKLFKVKSTATADDIATAYSNLTAAQNALKTAQQNKITLQSSLEQARDGIIDAQQAVDDMQDARIADPNVYSQNEIDSIESALTSARYTFNAAEKKYVEADVAINAAQAALASKQLAYESTKTRTIISPTIGTISNVSVSIGSSITASSGNSSLAALGLVETATPALTIANFSSNEVILKVNETDISKIQVGQATTIEPDALHGVVYSGIVKRIDDIGHDDDGVIVFNVYVDVLDADEKLKSGMTVDIDIVTNELKDVLSVKSTAVKPYQGGKAVRILNKKTKEIEYIPVVIGVRGSQYTQILEGVEIGQEIIVSLSNEKIKRSGPLGF